MFNKAADSCDYARNVICSKTKPTTEAPVTVAPSTTPSYQRTTSTTSTTTTTEAPIEEEEEYEYEEEAAEDPRAIKELLDLIKRLGESPPLLLI